MKLPIELIDKIAFYTNDIDTHTSLRKAISITNPNLFRKRMKEFVKDYLPDLIDMVGGIDKLAESEYLSNIDHYNLYKKRMKEFVKDYLPDLVDMVGGIDKLAEPEYLSIIDHYKINFSSFFRPVYDIKPWYLSHNIMVGKDSDGFKFLCVKFYEEKSESVLLDDKIPYTMIFYQTHSIESKMWKTTISKNKYTTSNCSINVSSDLFLNNDHIYNAKSIEICKEIIKNKFVLDDTIKRKFEL